MRDVSHKSDTLRTAVAEATVTMRPETVELVREGRAPKGDPLPVARTAAMLAAKDTPKLIPYCHSVPLDQILIDFELQSDRILCRASVKAIYKTGVEIEAMTAAAVAALNVYDMLKLVDESMAISDVSLVEKTGGKLGQRPGLRAGIIVVSDSVANEQFEDTSGALLEERLAELGLEVEAFEVVPDEVPRIQVATLGLAEDLDLVVLTGGTGVGPRDVTPEAVRPLLTKSLPGVEEAIRAYGQRRTPFAMLSRSLAGVRGNCVILALPGSPNGVRDALHAVMPALLHAVEVIGGARH